MSEEKSEEGEIFSTDLAKDNNGGNGNDPANAKQEEPHAELHHSINEDAPMLTHGTDDYVEFSGYQNYGTEIQQPDTRAPAYQRRATKQPSALSGNAFGFNAPLQSNKDRSPTANQPNSAGRKNSSREAGQLRKISLANDQGARLNSYLSPLNQSGVHEEQNNNSITASYLKRHNPFYN